MEDYLIAGELSLSGATRPVRGGSAMARLARKLGKRGVLLPPSSAEEAALVEGIAVFSVDSLDCAFRFLAGERPLVRLESSSLRPWRASTAVSARRFFRDQGPARAPARGRGRCRRTA